MRFTGDATTEVICDILTDQNRMLTVLYAIVLTYAVQETMSHALSNRCKMFSFFSH